MKSYDHYGAAEPDSKQGNGSSVWGALGGKLQEERKQTGARDHTYVYSDM